MRWKSKSSPQETPRNRGRQAANAVSGMSKIPLRNAMGLRSVLAMRDLGLDPNYGTSCRVWVVCVETAEEENGSAKVAPE